MKCLISGLLLFCFIYCEARQLDDAHDWDLLIFTQQWPVTACKEWKLHNQSHTCQFPKKSGQWTVHGIWPTKLGTIGPGFCNRDWHFDPEEIRSIEYNLTQLWTNIEAETPIYAFWAHEWTKHGTCAAILPPLNSQIKYFTKGLNWEKNYTMTDILQEADIIPSNDKGYSITDLHNAVKVRLGINPAIECRKIHGKSFLIEMRICFDKDLKLENCNGILDYPRVMLNDDTIITNCDTSLEVVYPQDTDPDFNSNLYIQLYKLVSWLQWFTL